MNIKQIKKSPFILATVAGIIAVVADIAWIVSELLHVFHVQTELGHIIVRFGVAAGLIASVILAIIAIHYYLLNGYVANDRIIEKTQCIKRIADKKRKKIFK